jgi:hypothetical protein
MRLGRKLATGVVAESAEEMVLEQAVESADAPAEELGSELPDELATHATAS